MPRAAVLHWSSLLTGLVTCGLAAAGPVVEHLQMPVEAPKVRRPVPITIRAREGFTLQLTLKDFPKYRPPNAEKRAKRGERAQNSQPATRPRPPLWVAWRHPIEVPVQRGQVIVAANQPLTRFNHRLLQTALRETPQENVDVLGVRLVLLFSLIALVVWLAPQLTSTAAMPRRGQSLLCLLPGLGIFMVYAVRLLTPFPLGVAPLAIGALLAGVALGRRAALLVAAVSVAAVGVTGGADPASLWPLWAGALAAALVPVKRRLLSLIPAALAAGAFQGAVSLSLGPVGEPVGAEWAEVEWMFLPALGPLAAGLLALMLAWPTFLGWAGTTSAGRLRRLSAPRHPLMQQLRLRATGTYQHALNVAVLAEAAARAIGGDRPLVRAGAMYHDVGKLLEPEYFEENNQSGPDPHARLTPSESALRIRRHVRDGLKIAAQWRLPGELRQFIAEHHGTAALKGPLGRAERRGWEIDPTVYYYPGPLPRTREAAILMVCNAVEVASRELDDPELAAVSQVAEGVVKRLMTEYQFEDCDVSQVELVRLQEVLAQALRRRLHRRVPPSPSEEQV